MSEPAIKSRRDVLQNRREGESFELRHGGKRDVFTITISRYPDGRVAEIFIAGGKSGTEVEANVRDTAILTSLALQHGAPIEMLAAALTREGDGSASTIIGAVLDRLIAPVSATPPPPPSSSLRDTVRQAVKEVLDDKHDQRQ